MSTCYLATPPQSTSQEYLRIQIEQQSKNIQKLKQLLTLEGQDTERLLVGSVLAQMAATCSPTSPRKMSVDIPTPTSTTVKLPSFTEFLRGVPAIPVQRQKAPVKIQPHSPVTPSSPSPSTCSTTSSSRPKPVQMKRKSEDGPESMSKTIRYDQLLDGTEVIRKCGDCRATRTSGHWCQDSLVVGGYICQKCYRRRKRSGPEQSLLHHNRSCNQCKTTKEAMWFKHPLKADKFLCSGCHDTSACLVSKADKCFGCGTLKSTKWTQDSKGNMVCRKCTRQLAVAIKKGLLEGDDRLEQALDSFDV